MNKVTFSVEMSGYEGDSARQGERLGRRVRDVDPSSSRGAADLILVIATVAIALGLAAVTAGLAPSADAPGPPMPVPRQRAISSNGAMEPRTRESGRDRPQSGVMSVDRTRIADPAEFPRISATGPWKSRLYPQNGVTLWDRIRVSSQRNRGAFLLGTTIQIHAPATAATPSASHVRSIALGASD